MYFDFLIIFLFNQCTKLTV
uniref:Uncharacterized protein n=1 Tax=Rhizophora mucronata TaxID=61149 RepID=A0A2P2QHS6_RHIMU